MSEAFLIPKWGKILGIGLALLFLAVFYTGLYIPPGLNADGAKIMGLILFAISLFITQPISNRHTCLFVVLLMIIGGFSITTVFRYFTRDTPWMMTGVYALTTVMRTTGLAQRVALNLMKRVGKNYFVLLATIFVLNILFSFMGVSSVQRAQIVGAIVAPMMIAAGAEPWSIGRAGPILWNIAAAYITDRMILTGSTANLMFLDIMDFEWDFTTWFINMGIPYAITAVIMMVIWWLFMRPKTIKPPDVSALDAQLKAMGPLSLNEKKLIVYLALLFVLVMTQPYHGLGPGYQMLGIAALLATPVIGVFSLSHWMRTVPWDTLFMGIFTTSYGVLATSTGFAAAFGAALVFPGLPNIPLVVMVYFCVIALIVKVGLTNNLNTFSLMLPTVSAWATGAGLPTAGYGAATYLTHAPHAWFVFQHGPLIYMMGFNAENQLYTDRHILLYGFLVLATMLISIPIWFTYWSMLGLA